MARNVALVGNVLFSVAEAAGVLIFARVADRVGKHRVAIWSAFRQVPFAYPFFWLINTRECPS